MLYSSSKRGMVKNFFIDTPFSSNNLTKSMRSCSRACIIAPSSAPCGHSWPYTNISVRAISTRFHVNAVVCVCRWLLFVCWFIFGRIHFVPMPMDDAGIPPGTPYARIHATIWPIWKEKHIEDRKRETRGKVLVRRWIKERYPSSMNSASISNIPSVRHLYYFI